MRKKGLAALMAAAMVVSLAACGSEGGADPQKKETDNGDAKG
ncbi:MAG: hypothetical protein ACLRMZ_06875 [Blautia marasmi]